MTFCYKKGDKLYIVTRNDLDPGYQAVQSIHAMRQFVAEHPEVDRHWFEVSNYLALLATDTESDICDLIAHACDKGIRFSVFREPDIGNQITAVAFEPGNKTVALCKKLPLALK